MQSTTYKLLHSHISVFYDMQTCSDGPDRKHADTVPEMRQTASGKTPVLPSSGHDRAMPMLFSAGLLPRRMFLPQRFSG